MVICFCFCFFKYLVTSITGSQCIYLLFILYNSSTSQFAWGNIIPLCWTYSERAVLQWKHYIKSLISTLTHWNSLKHEMDSCSTSLFTSRHIRELGCCQERGRPTLLFLSQDTSCTITTFHFSSCSLLFKVCQVWKTLYGCSCKKKMYLGRASKGDPF